jgi:hypothetical protein
MQWMGVANYHEMNTTLAAAVLFAGVCIAFAQSGHTPTPGSAERKAIMDVLRPVCERDVGQKVIFVFSICG